MLISGLQKLTLLDYPGLVACTVFTGGCNFRCPFCHNAPLVLPEELAHDTDEEQVLSFLKKRVGVLDGVAITGGEPLLHSDIGAFLEKVRTLGCILGVVQKIAQKQAFVSRGGDLRHEDAVIRVMIVLRLIRVEAVHGVAELVDQGENVVQRAVVVQQQVRKGVVAAA